LRTEPPTWKASRKHQNAAKRENQDQFCAREANELEFLEDGLFHARSERDAEFLRENDERLRGSAEN